MAQDNGCTLLLHVLCVRQRQVHCPIMIAVLDRDGTSENLATISTAIIRVSWTWRKDLIYVVSLDKKLKNSSLCIMWKPAVSLSPRHLLERYIAQAPPQTHWFKNSECETPISGYHFSSAFQDTTVSGGSVSTSLANQSWNADEFSKKAMNFWNRAQSCRHWRSTGFNLGCSLQLI